MEIWNSKASQICISIANLAFTAEIHKRRSTTLAYRVKIIVETITTIDLTSVASNLRVKGSLSLLDVLFEEINDYLQILQQKDNALARRVKRCGSDEETFSKWNETLKSCCEDLGLSSLENLFDASKDLEDFNIDMENLNADLKNILEKVVDVFGTPEQAIEAIQKLLQQQHTQRTQYKTQQAVKADKKFDIKSIRWEKEIGRGGNHLILKLRVWRCLESQV